MTTVDQDVRTPLARLLGPRSIAVIGASTDPAKRGHRLATATERSDLDLPIPPVSTSDGTCLLAEPAARDLIESAGIDTGRWVLAATPAEAQAAVTRFGAPCAVKLASPRIAHKSDAGGVRIGVTDGENQLLISQDICNNTNLVNPARMLVVGAKNQA